MKKLNEVPVDRHDAESRTACMFMQDEYLKTAHPGDIFRLRLLYTLLAQRATPGKMVLPAAIQEILRDYPVKREPVKRPGKRREGVRTSTQARACR